MKEKQEIQLIRMLKKILPADESSRELAAKRWMTVGKPLFSLGKLEQAVIDIAGMKGTAKYTLEKKGLLIFCADNGVVQEGVTQTGQEVTAVVAENFTKRAASVCLMAERAGVDIFPVDIGMVRDVPGVTRQEYKIAYGTKDFPVEPAMTREEAAQAVLTGIRLVKEKKEEGYEILATGEMGIGNTTTSSAVVSVLLKEPVEAVTGKGAGLSGAGLGAEKRSDTYSRGKTQAGSERSAGCISESRGIGYCGDGRRLFGAALCTTSQS